MPNFDLSNPADFSRITQQTLSSLIPLFGGRDPREWDLLEGSYNGIIFHVFQSKVQWQGAVRQIQDIGGRRKVKYQFPYRDGQTTDDLGRKPGVFDVEIVLFGQRYITGFRQLLTEFDKPTPGELIHPIRGKIPCAVEDVQITHSQEQRKAVMLRVTFIEHNFTIGDLTQLRDNTVKGALASALDLFAKIDNAISKVEAAVLFVRAAKNRINALLSAYKTTSGQLLTDMNKTFNPSGSADIPSLLPVNEGGTRQTDGSVTDENFVVVRSISDPFNSVPVDLLSQETVVAIAVQELTKRLLSARADLAVIIQDIIDSGGALELYDTILDLRRTAVLMQDVLEKGISSSNASVADYVTPRVMSLREVAFANGLDVNRVGELDLLNPDLLSTNFIAAGVSLKVPVT